MLTIKYSHRLAVIVALLVATFAVGTSTIFSVTGAKVELVLSDTTLQPGDEFEAQVVVTPSVAVAGVQFDLTVDPTKLEIKSVAEVDFLKQGGAQTVLLKGTIDNASGTLIGVAGVITQQGATVNTKGVFAVVTLRVRDGASGAADIQLSNVIVGDASATELEIDLTNNGKATVQIGSPTQVSLSPSTQTVTAGGAFQVRVDVSSEVGVATVKFDLSFDRALLEVLDVVEGPLLSQSGTSTSFENGIIDNTAGTLTGVSGAIVPPGQSTSTAGTFAIVNLSAKPTAQGTASLQISNVVLSNSSGDTLPIELTNGGAAIVTFSGPQPVLSIPGKILVTAGDEVVVPVHFTGNLAEIVSVAFSVDFDNACLSFDGADANGDNIPDGIKITAPNIFGFTVISFDAQDEDGEIDVIIADVSSPLSSFSDGSILEMTFKSMCLPNLGQSIVAPVTFSIDPPPSFSDSSARDVPGEAVGGSVEIIPLLGDCNKDSKVNIADASAIGVEIFDGDGDLAVDAPQGGFAGDPAGCDSNEDSVIRVSDLTCVVLIMFNGTRKCLPDAGSRSAGPGQRTIVYQDIRISEPSPTVGTLVGSNQ